MRYKIAVFPGDGVGPELINEGIKIIGKAAELGKFEIEWAKYPYGAEHYLETKELLNEKTLREVKNSCNAVYCGTFENFAVDGRSERNVPALIKGYFDQCISLRPIKLLPNIDGCLSGKTCNDIDFAIIRENTEDFYIGLGGRVKNGKNKNQLEANKSACKAKFCVDAEAKQSEIAYQIGILSKKGCERAIKYAFEYAKTRSKNKVTAIDKANIVDYYNFWRESLNKTAKDYQGIEYEFELIDAAVMNFVRQPEKYQVIAAPNMFGDILSDLGTVLQGGILFGARGNINPEGISMFEPIHGSAPKLKGRGILNPIATIWAGALMLDSIGQHKPHDLIIKSIEAVLKEGRAKTQDLDGNNTTSEMGDAILDKFVELHD